MHTETQSTRRDGTHGVCFRWRGQPWPNKTNLCENCYKFSISISPHHAQRRTMSDCFSRRQKVQRLKSPLEGFSPGVHLRGCCHGDRIGGHLARSALSGAVSTACLSSYDRNSFRSPRPQSKAYWQTRPVPHTRTAATQRAQRFLPNCSLRRCGEMDILQATRR